MSWQPIESAPKDGTKVLVVASLTNLGRHHFIAQHTSVYGWVTHAWSMKDFQPTHWMPLPEFPS